LRGRDYELEVRWAEGRYGRFPAFARELIEKHPTVILATTIAAVRALQHISATVPIVMTTINDPVGAGLVASLPRPGGNSTGIANLTEDVTPKVLEILLSVLPTASAIAALFNPANPSNRLMLDKIVAHAGAVGVMVHPFELKEAEELAAAIGVLAERRPDALLVINDAAILDLRERIVAAALAHRLRRFPLFRNSPMPAR
jgi:putative ABC transport system substrate-binding protein